MARVAITEQYLEDIADAIRSKTGMSSATYYPSQMANAIMTISGGGGITPTGTISITENGTYNVTSYASASVSVPTGSTINNQDKTVNPSTSQQTVTADSGYTGLGAVTITAMPSGTAGTPTATKGTVSNHSISVTPSVINTTGYITGSTKTGTAVTVSASELVSGNKAISSNGTNIDVTNYATVSVSVDGGGGITPTGNINITQAGETDVTNYATATVATVGYVGVITPTVTKNGGEVDSYGVVSIPWVISENIHPIYTGGYASEEDEITLWNSGNLQYQLNTISFPTSTSSSATSGYSSKATINRSTSDQYINISPGYNGSGVYYKISAVANGSATPATSISGTSATITTGTNTITLTKSVSNTPQVSAGYVSAGTAGNSSVSLTASVTVNPTPTASGATVTIPAGYYSSQTTKSVSSGSASAPSTISGTSATVSTGTNTITLTKTVSVTPTVSAGYVSSGTATNSSVSLTASVTTKAAATITPGTTDQTIASGTYLTGAQTISGDADLVAGNIKKNVSIFGVTGTYEGSGGSSMGIDTAEVVTSTTSTLVFTGLKGDPTYFSVNVDDNVATGSPAKIVAIVFDGTSIHTQTVSNTSNAQVSYVGTGVTKSYSNGTLTLISTGPSFITNSLYFIDYTYSGGVVDTKDVQVGSGATSITFTELDDEPAIWSCIFKSNFSTSSGYQRVIFVGEAASNIVTGYAMDSQANINTQYWTATYNNGSFTITSQGTNAGGYFHQPGYYQLTYVIGESSDYQQKTVTPTTSQQVITADTGYLALSKVTVNAIPNTYVQPTATKGATTYTPTTTNQTIASGTYLTGVQTIAGDADLVASNIVSGVQIFGVTGNVVLQNYYTGSSAPSSSTGSNGDLYLQS